MKQETLPVEVWIAVPSNNSEPAACDSITCQEAVFLYETALRLLLLVVIIYQEGGFDMASLYQIDLKTQQLIVDALGKRTHVAKKALFSHDASRVTSRDGLLVATHDRLDEFLAHKQLEVISILPNVSLVKKLRKTSLSENLSIELVFICNSTSDPVEVVLDLIGKFSTEHIFINKAEYLTSLPAGTFRKRVECDAYTIGVTTCRDDSFQLIWKMEPQFFREALIPKAILHDPDIARLLDDRKGPFTCKAYKKNCCREIGNAGTSCLTS